MLIFYQIILPHINQTNWSSYIQGQRFKAQYKELSFAQRENYHEAEAAKQKQKLKRSNVLAGQVFRLSVISSAFYLIKILTMVVLFCTMV